jgi:hypothetical protein
VFNVTDGNKLPYDPFFFSAVKQENMKDPSGQNAFRVCRICVNNTLLVLSASIDRATVDQLANDTVTMYSTHLRTTAKGHSSLHAAYRPTFLDGHSAAACITLGSIHTGPMMR